MLHQSSFHHFYLNKQDHPSPHKHRIDYVIYIVVSVGPLSNIPQLYNVWILHETDGVSELSWSIFAVISLMWLIYGIVHRERPIIIMNAVLVVIQAVIGVGIILY